VAAAVAAAAAVVVVVVVVVGGGRVSVRRTPVGKMAQSRLERVPPSAPSTLLRKGYLIALTGV